MTKKVSSVKHEDPTKHEVVEDTFEMFTDESITYLDITNFKKKKYVEVCYVCSNEFWGRPSLLKHVLKEI